MGTKDAVGKKYFSDPKRFADVVNFCIFSGRQVVLPENLREMDTTEIVMLDLIGAEKDQEERPNKKRKKLPREEYAVQKMRDLLKEAVIKYDGHCKYVLIGIENQTDIYYAMPVRDLVYDSLHYLSDVHRIGRENEENGKIKACKDPGAYTSKFLKDDKLTPIVTIVVYWGADRWIACRSFRELFPEDTPEEILRYTPDYTMPIIAPGEIEDFSAFRTEAGTVFQIVSASDDGAKLRQLVNDYLADKPLNPDSVQTLNTYLGTTISTEEGGTTVCKAIDDLIKESKAEGLAEGKAKGLVEGKIAAIVKLITDGIITLQQGAAQLGVSEAEMQKMTAAKQ